MPCKNILQVAKDKDHDKHLLIDDHHKVQTLTRLKISLRYEYLGNYLDERESDVNILSDLERLLKEEWYSLTPEYLNNLVGSMNKSCQSIAKANGGHTKVLIFFSYFFFDNISLILFFTYS